MPLERRVVPVANHGVHRARRDKLAELKYCPECAAPLVAHRVAGELRAHRYCARCAEPRVDHPMIVVTTFIACGKRLLWVQRAQDPQRGRWAIPGGFLEKGETLAEGAARELREEAGVELPAAALSLYMMGTITFINQIYVGFRATVTDESCLAGVESMACRYFARDECPWDEVAYPQVNNSILQAYDDLDSGRFDIWHAQMTSEDYELKPVSQRSR